MINGPILITVLFPCIILYKVSNTATRSDFSFRLTFSKNKTCASINLQEKRVVLLKKKKHEIYISQQFNP